MERVDTNPLDGTTISAMDSPEIHPEINPTDDFDAPSINTNTAVSTGEPSPLDYHEETSFTALDQVDSIEDTLEHGTYQPYWNKYLPEKKESCCEIDKALRDVPPSAFTPSVSSDPTAQMDTPIVTITTATKSNDATGSYIGYVINTRIPNTTVQHQAKHRYSEFESLVKVLTKVYPTCVIPPIPEKHSVTDYAVRQSKAKDDPRIINKRKRMLQTFLNRLLGHVILGRDHAVHRFLEGVAPWKEIVVNSGYGQVLKQVTPGSLAGVSDKANLKDPDPHFLAAEDFTAKFAAQLTLSYKSHRRVHKHFLEMANTSTDLGASYNGWSLMESSNSPLSQSIERVGEAIDNTVGSLSGLVQNLEEKYTEPMQSYSNYSQKIEKLLRWRHKKHVELEQISNLLTQKEEQLLRLSESESESQRISAVLGASSPNTENSPYPSQRNTSSSNSSAARSSGIFATLNSFIDNDPETTRRNQLSKTKDRIKLLKKAKIMATIDLEKANLDIQANLDRFQKEKVKDFRNMLLEYAISQRDAHKKCISAWGEAKGDLARISG